LVGPLAGLPIGWSIGLHIALPQESSRLVGVSLLFCIKAIAKESLINVFSVKTGYTVKPQYNDPFNKKIPAVKFLISSLFVVNSIVKGPSNNKIPVIENKIFRFVKPRFSCNFLTYFWFYPIHFDKKGLELNQMIIFSNVMFLGSFLFIFVIVMHILLCLSALYFFPIITPHLLLPRFFFASHLNSDVCKRSPKSSPKRIHQHHGQNV
jgi:hypothetical protein